MGLLSNSYFAFFLIVALGYILGKIKIKGISLDVSAVIFVALIFGHYGVQVPVDFQYIGLVLFIFTIAIQAGPGFVQSFRKQGSSLIILTLILILSALFSSILLSKLFNVDPILGIGLLSGALTSTPGLAVAIDSTNSTLASIGYGIAYPFGVLGVILFVRLYPKFTRVNLVREEEKINNEVLTEYPEIYSNQYMVEIKNILGKSLKYLYIGSMTGASISRVSIESITMAPTP
ncbi:MAG: transporter, partial [Bacteroidales bacterium]|nr:transporter [Bacteroidales bacterium]